MEEGGRVRRGYFVAGRGATQFAVPGADDRLRGARAGARPVDADTSSDEAPTELDAGDDEAADDEGRKVYLLAATDPANPYGGAIPWPASSSSSTGGSGKGPQRAAGARVFLGDGQLLGWLAKKSDQLLTFFAEDDAVAKTRLAEALADLGHRRLRVPLFLATIDGAPAAESPFAAALLEAGFVRRGSALGFRPDPLAGGERAGDRRASVR
jgi:ATP-dependent Lhr-like helicase